MPGAATNLGQLYLQQRDYAKAIEVLRAAAAAEPYNATAAYGLATALTRSNDPGARAAMDRFQALRNTGYAITYSQAYLQQGRYGEAVASTGAETELVDRATPEVGFTDVTSSAGQALEPRGARLGPLTLADLDGDGDLDLIDGGGAVAAGVPQRRRPLRGCDGRLVRQRPARAGDRHGRRRLRQRRAHRPPGAAHHRPHALQTVAAGRLRRRHRARGTGRAASRPPAARAAWVDADHDGDLDLIVSYAGGGAAGLQVRSTTRCCATTATAPSPISPRWPASPPTHPLAAIVPTDFDNRRDIDLLMAGSGGAPLLFRNMRDGTFKDVAAEAGLRVTGDVSAIAAGDINKDGYPDFFFGRADGPGTLALSDGRAGFKTSPLPEAANARAAQILDYDADGLLDLLIVTDTGPRMLRNTGSGWVDVTARAFPGPLATAAAWRRRRASPPAISTEMA